MKGGIIFLGSMTLKFQAPSSSCLPSQNPKDFPFLGYDNVKGKKPLL